MLDDAAGFPTLFDEAQGGDERPVGLPNWRCPICGSAEILVRWEAFGSQTGVLDSDGRFKATAPVSVYECTSWTALRCIECEEPVPNALSQEADR